MPDPRTRRRTRRRKQKLKQRQLDIQFNWFLGFIVLLCWGVLAFIFVYVEPALVADIPLPGWYGPFFLAVFAVVYTTSLFIGKNHKRSGLLAGGLVSYLVLRLNQLDQWYIVLLLVSLVLAIEYFWVSQFKYDWVSRLRQLPDKVESEHE